MKHWRLAAVLICFGSRVKAQELQVSVSTPSQTALTSFDRQRIDALDQEVLRLNHNINSTTGPGLASTQTWSGTNTFTSVTKISSGMCVNFSPSLGFTSAVASWTTAATITGSTVTWTQQGTRAACWFSGGASNNATSHNDIIGFECDGANIGSQSASSGIGVTVGGAGQGQKNLSFAPYEFTTTAGQHSCYLGIWLEATGETITFPYTKTASQFCCREVNSQ